MQLLEHLPFANKTVFIGWSKQSEAELTVRTAHSISLRLRLWTFLSSSAPSSFKKSFWKTSKVYFSFFGYSRLRAYINPINSMHAVVLFPQPFSTLMPSITTHTSAGSSSTAGLWITTNFIISFVWPSSLSSCWKNKQTKKVSKLAWCLITVVFLVNANCLITSRIYVLISTSIKMGNIKIKNPNSSPEYPIMTQLLIKQCLQHPI